MKQKDRQWNDQDDMNLNVGSDVSTHPTLPHTTDGGGEGEREGRGKGGT